MKLESKGTMKEIASSTVTDNTAALMPVQ